MPAYVVDDLRAAASHPDVAEYIERLPGTMEPYGGRRLVDFTEHEVKEDGPAGDVVILGFPGIDEARAWWDSPARREIAPLRSRHVTGDVVMVDGVPEDYTPTATFTALLKGLASG
ncbi:DUF1330 domain-containing protein [Yinghuangia seranimata]|uniref:DUF1330 domain-containing protein n=1 Tax=Yinghuangia seranimata TaxID=408067 RepID=UPI00248BD743|nr:DUF1330 domain-containing protein [Yinghuangia seranimata]MDI2129615.1 DUF1330 domain-containing protein [Yinghuangia seranimata]